MTAYYNEIDPFAAAWLRELIKAGHIAPGEVDERSIVDVKPSDLVGYSQCHFFAGIGVWSYALRRAGWPDDRPVWTGSCPCQPFSAAGKGEGFADERHLWPSFHWLIQQRRPPIIFGEQVASKDADPWIDLVQDDLEAMDYAFGAVPFPSASIGAPHIRDRLYWLADASISRGLALDGKSGSGVQQQKSTGGCDTSGSTANADSRKRHGEPVIRGAVGDGEDGRRSEGGGIVKSCGEPIRLVDGVGEGLEGHRSGHQAEIGHREGSLRSIAETSELGGLAYDAHIGHERAREARGRWSGLAHDGAIGVGHNGGPELDRPGPVNGRWEDADWLFCRDGKWRPVEPGTFPLAHGLARSMAALSPELAGLAKVAGLDNKSLARAKAFRVGSLKGYGNAINAEAAVAFVEAFIGEVAA